jgi:hypothetical protein
MIDCLYRQEARLPIELLQREGIPLSLRTSAAIEHREDPDTRERERQ